MHRLALWMRPAAPVLAIAGWVLLAICGGLLLIGPASAADRVLLPAIAAMLWCLCGYVFIKAFESVPAPPASELRGWARAKRRLARGCHWLLALVFLGATVGALLITKRVVDEALG